ncbi:uncharacterized protein LACBIDRAFT_311702 [Laccaria bicolor S238N-H82]|uniref:Golgi apparatus membrane protein TVP38 n=1 Tax=Laccaria bicolor (strain S238N-H82 / ATCC MYA-4686) TaxID=486041 RepID=B0CY29_LACBS|nr:uncharacterized protein LACBIDRAFT_311702 [Laccaria bicolor S238N-H82]EDR12371.1 predicted protein [Laccaria bicolor S238N-H82]|eukprot:XP_001876635.1 predicted protein [Laccaria bicolor S238N-H82]
MILSISTLIIRKLKSLNLATKLFLCLLVVFYLSLGVLVIIISPARIAQYLYDQAHILAEAPFGSLALALAIGLYTYLRLITATHIHSIVCISFPPLIGHTTLVTLCGFAYGLNGIYIAAGVSIVGSALVFVVLRFLFSARLRAWSGHNQKWQALESVVRAKGLPLVVLIRISPFPPWVYSNSLFASIEAVKLWQFVIATFCIIPKLLLHTFIGSKIAQLSDGDQRGRMDTHTKVINGLLVGGGILIAIFTSWLVYNLVQNHIRHLEGISPDVDELAAEAIEDFDEEDPLISHA